MDNKNKKAEEQVDVALCEKFKKQIDNLTSRTDELEKKVNKVTRLYQRQQKPKPTTSKKAVSRSSRYGSGNVAMQEVIRQFGSIMQQILQHKWAWPFMEPVDVEGLGLHDYYEVIKKPMDFTTIRNRMKGKHASGYKNVREIYADVRLIFTNAMTYNEEKSDVHEMAKTLLKKFEEKWLQILPKVIDAETRQKEEEEQALADIRNAQEAAVAKMARDADSELDELNTYLKEFRELVAQKCRKMSTEEKRKLAAGLSTLSPEDLSKALEIIAEENPNFQATAEFVDVDMDALTATTLLRLKFFVKGALEVQAKRCAGKAENLNRKKEMKSKKLPS